ncbi:helix-turn-helix domain-containing protein [Actinotalea sp. M2MS4P-6]|uniref:winged helix-turn-helix domain-containing protein n=1 Tax=Actinotalea sp. M2MS4P-6 TaxID=2983762 RepID=UPI0021E4EF64|nr:helix-turn-helix domain-containing protein [Actinotalea sp. M2MS4P-6]MCV2395331.1 helix-turn-helix domain-containing protein [Actinotalea sp. M2MS4P-6]
MADATPHPGPEALKAFTHPLRMAMFEYLRDHGSATATQLARAMDESTGQTSYHLRQLAKHGFVEDDPEHAGGRERWWRPVGFQIGPDDLADSETLGALTGMLGARFAIRAAVLQRWLEHLPDEDEEWREAGMANEGSTQLTADELRAMSEELEAVMMRHFEDAKRRRDSGDGLERRRIRVHLDAFPIPPDGPAAARG